MGRSFASFRRFCAVAARWNSSRAPFGPRNRRRPRSRMRFKCANSISTVSVTKSPQISLFAASPQCPILAYANAEYENWSRSALTCRSLHCRALRCSVHQTGHSSTVQHFRRAKVGRARHCSHPLLPYQSVLYALHNSNPQPLKDIHESRLIG